MLRLYDAVARAPKEVRPGPLRIEVHGADQRVHVTADVLRRFAERRGHRVLIGHSGTTPSWHPAELNVQPMEWPPGDADLHICTAAPDTPADPATPDATTAPDAATTPPAWRVVVIPMPGSWPDADPLAVRLAMLSVRYRAPMEPDAASGAGDRLRRWRELVASWANSPGRPMSAGHVSAAAEAFDDDLDTPAVLSLLDRLADDPEIPPGSKFETFAYLDLILGLDLVSAIGRQ